MIDQVLLNNTLQKINESLNKRFEKNADLYISRQDEQELKENICSNKFASVSDMMRGRGISPDIVFKVIVRNAGVIDVKDIKKFEKNLGDVLTKVDYKNVFYIMEDILYNNVYIQDELKCLLLKYFILGMDFEKRVDFWNEKKYHFNINERKIIFDSIVLDSESKEKLKFKLDFIKKAFIKYPNLLNDREVLIKLKNMSDENEKLEIFKNLCTEIDEPSLDDDLYNHILIDLISSYKIMAFDYCTEKIKNKEPKGYKTHIQIISRVMFFEYKENLSTSVELFDKLLNVYNNKSIKENVKGRIFRKIWVMIRIYNKELYNEKEKEINKIKSERQTEVEKLYGNKEIVLRAGTYNSYNEIKADIIKGVPNVSIAYNWFDIMQKNRDGFIKSIKESFSNQSNASLSKLKEVYYWLFKHRKARSGNEDLSKICECISKSIISFGNINNEYVKEMDFILLEHLKRYRVSGPNIDSYLTKYHFKEYQEILKES